LHTPTSQPQSDTPGRRAESVMTLSLAEARCLPAISNPRLFCRSYAAPPRLLPNGLPRTTPLVADALLLIGGTFLVTARILRDGPGRADATLRARPDPGRL